MAFLCISVALALCLFVVSQVVFEHINVFSILLAKTCA